MKTHSLSAQVRTKSLFTLNPSQQYHTFIGRKSPSSNYVPSDRIWSRRIAPNGVFIPKRGTLVTISFWLKYTHFFCRWLRQFPFIWLYLFNSCRKKYESFWKGNQIVMENKKKHFVKFSAVVLIIFVCLKCVPNKLWLHLLCYIKLFVIISERIVVWQQLYINH